MLKQLVMIGAISVAGLIFAEEGHEHAHSSSHVEVVGETVWTCSMHPQIRMTRPGKCPLCHMDLIPLRESPKKSADAAEATLSLSPYAEKLAGIRTTKAERKFVAHELLLNGKLDYDESSIADIALRFPGRIDKLYVNYTGVVIRRGDHIAEVFSPELAVMQNEYLTELKSSRTGALESVMDKMRQWGFSPEQIDEIGKRGKVSNLLTVNSPIDGTVIEKHVVEGGYFDKEEQLFRIADLSRLWLVLDVYEMDLPFLHYGQEVEFRADALPGETLRGIVSYIGPELNPATRTVPVRVNLKNLDGKLKPGMFVRATVHAVLDETGKVIDDRLSGKWISPMHPEIIRDQQGACDICGMALVPAESLGYSGVPKAERKAPLVIPSTAPLLTGKRAIVYVRTAPGSYTARKVELGPKTGEFYPVLDGIVEGEDVVTVGNMKIDGAMQISGLPSMTSSENFGETAVVPAAVPVVVLDGVFQAILAAHAPLVKGDAKTSGAALAAVRKAAAELPDTSTERKELLAALPETLPETLEPLRGVYGTVSRLLSDWSDQPGFRKPEMKLHRFHCPMALGDKGGIWFQATGSIENPYYGAMMLKCGAEM